MNNTSVESFLAEGCGRCDKFQTPQCKVHRWNAELLALRALLRETGLVEEMKWGSPCYTWQGHNILMLSVLKDCAVVGFFRGALLVDEGGLLRAPGPNSQAARQLVFTSLSQVRQQADPLRAFIGQAVELARSGRKIEFARAPEPVPDELQERLELDPALAEAWAALTPGRQRSHVLHISGAKQAATRVTRVEKCAPLILAGRGLHDR